MSWLTNLWHRIKPVPWAGSTKTTTTPPKPKPPTTTNQQQSKKTINFLPPQSHFTPQAQPSKPKPTASNVIQAIKKAQAISQQKPTRKKIIFKKPSDYKNKTPTHSTITPKPPTPDLRNKYERLRQDLRERGITEYKGLVYNEKGIMTGYEDYIRQESVPTYKGEVPEGSKQEYFEPITTFKNPYSKVITIPPHYTFVKQEVINTKEGKVLRTTKKTSGVITLTTYDPEKEKEWRAEQVLKRVEEKGSSLDKALLTTIALTTAKKNNVITYSVGQGLRSAWAGLNINNPYYPKDYFKKSINGFNKKTLGGLWHKSKVEVIKTSIEHPEYKNPIKALPYAITTPAGTTITSFGVGYAFGAGTTALSITKPTLATTSKIITGVVGTGLITYEGYGISKEKDEVRKAQRLGGLALTTTSAVVGGVSGSKAVSESAWAVKQTNKLLSERIIEGKTSEIVGKTSFNEEQGIGEGVFSAKAKSGYSLKNEKALLNVKIRGKTYYERINPEEYQSVEKITYEGLLKTKKKGLFGKWGVREKPISGELTRINKINIEGYKVKLEKAGGGVFYEEKVLTSNIKGYGSGRINLNNKKYFVKSRTLGLGEYEKLFGEKGGVETGLYTTKELSETSLVLGKNKELTSISVGKTTSLTRTSVGRGELPTTSNIRGSGGFKSITQKTILEKIKTPQATSQNNIIKPTNTRLSKTTGLISNNQKQALSLITKTKLSLTTNDVMKEALIINKQQNTQKTPSLLIKPTSNDLLTKQEQKQILKSEGLGVEEVRSERISKSIAQVTKSIVNEQKRQEQKITKPKLIMSSRSVRSDVKSVKRMLKQKTKQEVIIKTSEEQKRGLIRGLKQDLIRGYKQEQARTQTTKPSVIKTTITPPPTITITNPIIDETITPPPTPPLKPSFYLFPTRKTSFQTRGKGGKKYTPSVYSILTHYEQPRPKKKKKIRITGFEIRPILTTKKKKTNLLRVRI